MIGGTTTIRVDASGVHLVSAIPIPGFQVEIKKAGPEEVRVQYESDDHESDFKAEWEDGQVTLDLDEEPKDDDDDDD